MALTRILDQPLEPLATFFGYRPEDLAIGLGTGIIEKTIEVIEDKVAKGWWKAFLYAFGSLSTLYLGGKSRDPRTKTESAIISMHLACDLGKLIVENWDEIHKSIAEFADAVARGDLESALNTMVKTDTIEGLMAALASGQSKEPEVEVVNETISVTPTVTETKPVVTKKVAAIG